MAEDRLFIPQINLPQLVSNARKNPIYSQRLSGMDDFEVYQYIKDGWKEHFDLDDAPEDWKREHFTRKAEEAETDDGKASFNSRFAERKDVDPDFIESGVDWSETIFGFGGVYQIFPDWIEQAIKLGANESITGIAVHLLSGEAPFKQDMAEAFGVDEKGNPNVSIMQNALAMAVGMGYDAWMFMNPITAGTGLTIKIAGKEAAKQAGKQLAKSEFGTLLHAKLVLKGLGEEGAEEGFEGLTKTAINKAARAKNSSTAEGMKDYLVKNSKLNGSTQLDDLVKTAYSNSDENVKLYLGSKDWVRGTEKALAEAYGKTLAKEATELLPKYSLLRLAASHGSMSAKALGSYSGIQNAMSQMRQSLEKQYGPDEANGILERWHSDGTWLAEDIKWQDVLYSAGHGYVGGFAAGALGGVMAAGRAGAFRKGERRFFDKYMKNSNPAIQRKLYEGWKAKGVWAAGEGLGFTVAGALTDAVSEHILGYEGVPDHTFLESFVQNVATVGTMKVLHSGLRNARSKLNQPVQMLGSEIRKSAIRAQTRLKGIAKQLEVKTESEAKIKTIIAEDRAALDKASTKDVRELSDALTTIEKGEKAFAKAVRGEKTFKIKAIKEIEKAIDKIKSIADKWEGKDVDKSHLSYVLKELDKIKQGYGDLHNEKSDLARDILSYNKAMGRKKETRPAKRKRVLGVLKKIGGKATALVEKFTEKEAYDYIADRILAKLEGKGGRQSADEVAAEISARIKGKTDKEIVTRSLENMVDFLTDLTGQHKLSKARADANLVISSALFNWIEGKKSGTLRSNIQSYHDALRGITSFLAKKGLSLSEITEGLMQEHANTGARGGVAFQEGSYKKFNAIIKQISQLRDSGKIKIDAEYLPEKIVPTAKEIAEKAAPPQESIKTSVGVIKDTMLKFKKFASGVFKKGEKIDYESTDRAFVEPEVVQIAHFIQWLWGKRSTALVVPGQTAKWSEFGVENLQKPLRVGDIKFSNTKSKGKRKVTIYIMEKGKAKKDIPQFLQQIIIYEGQTKKALGYDVFKILDKVWKARKEQGAKDSEFLLGRTTTKASGGRPVGTFVPMEYSDLKSINDRYFLQKGVTDIEGNIRDETPHKIRTMWMGLAETIAQKAGLNSKQRESLLGYVDRYMLSHDDTGGKLLQVQREIKTLTGKTATGEKFYTPAQLNAVISYKQKIVLDLYNALIEGTLTKAKFNTIVKNAAKEFKEFERYDLFHDAKDPFSTSLTAGTVKGSKQKLGLSEHRVATSRELVNQTIEYLAKNKGAKVEFLKNKDYAGEFIDGLIRIVEGKADLTTFFHENVHRLEAFVRDSGNKRLLKTWEKGERTIEQWAKKNDDVRWDSFVEKYGDRAANEYLTQLSAEWSLKKSQTKNIGGRLRNWFKEMYSQIKAIMGIHNPQDVARIFGNIGEKGFSTVGYALEGKKYSKITYNDKVDKKQIEELKAALKATGVKNTKTLYYQLAKDLEIDPVKYELLSQWKYASLREHLDTIEIIIKEDGTHKKTRIASWMQLRRAVASMNLKHGIGKGMEKELKLHLGIRGGTMKYATEKQMQRYLDVGERMGEMKGASNNYKNITPDNMINAETAASFMDKKGIAVHPALGQMVMSVDYVMRKLGAEKIADLMLDHFQLESQLKGESAYRINTAMALLAGKYGKHTYWNNRRMMNEYMGYALDKDAMEGMKFDARASDFLKNALEKPESVEYKARMEIQKMTDFFWETLIDVAKTNIKNPRKLEQWMEENGKNFVVDYFTRVPTKEGRDFVRSTDNHELVVKQQFNALVEAIVKERNTKIEKLRNQWSKKTRTQRETRAFKKQIKELESEKQRVIEAVSDNSTAEFKKLRETAQRTVWDMTLLQRNIVHNPYLLKRVPRMPNLIKDSTGKEFHMYEMNFDKVMGRYINVMSSYLATASFFPSFTNLRSKFVRSSETSGQFEADVFSEHLKVLSAGGNEQGAFVEKAIRKRLGLESRDLAVQYWDSAAAGAGKDSAMFGLSSPLSGLKNLVIGTQQTVGIFGFKNYLRSIAFMLSPESKAVKKDLEREGAGVIGTKELDLTGFPDWIMRNVSFMKPTEVANRYYSAWAGLLTAEQAVSRLRGESWGLLGNFSANRAKKELKKKWQLTNDEIMHLQNHGLRKGEHGFAPSEAADLIEARGRAIRNKILHYSHIITQGATAEPFLPMWASGRKASALTLFYRMAYSGTYNVMKHVVAPLTKGNALPLVRYGLAGHVTGAALWSAYEAVMGSTPPKLNGDAVDRITQNLAKSETLGLFSFIFSPFKNWMLTDSLMQPAIIRNSALLAKEIYQGILSPITYKLTGGKKGQEYDSIQSLKNVATDMVPLISHALKAAEKQSNPYKKEMRQLGTFKNAFMESAQYAKKEQKTSRWNAGQTTNKIYYNLIKEAFLNNDMKSAARYWWATNLMMYDNYREFKGKEDYKPEWAKSHVINTLERAVLSINPMIMPKSVDANRGIRRRWFDKNVDFWGGGEGKEFVYNPGSYLNKEWQEKAFKHNKEFWWRYRQLNIEIRKLEYEYLNETWNKGYVIDALPIPPRKSFGGKRLYTIDEKWFKIRSKTSQIVK